MSKISITHRTSHSTETVEGDHFACIGSVRGWCGHKHTSLTAAMRCLRSDQAGCSRQGGYSDRAVYVMDENGHKIEAVDFDVNDY